MKERTGGATASGGRQGRPDTLELSLFCHQMALVLKSGIHPVEGIPLVAEEMVNPRLKQALGQAGKAALDGMPLHEAFKASGAFPSYLVTMTRLGEATGMLEGVMDDLSRFYEKEDRVAKRIRSAVAYPLLLLFLMLCVVALLVTQVLPMFAKILTSLGGELPDVTRAMLGMGDFFRQNGLWVLLALALAAAGLILVIRTEKGRLWWDAWKLKSPFFGRVLVKAAAARFSNGLALVLRSGMGLAEGLEEVQDLAANRQVRRMIGQVAHNVRDGMELGAALAPVALFPPLFTRMIQIGQKTGELDQMMVKLSSVYEGEVDNSIQQMTNAIEPVLVIILSVVVGVILLAVMLPLINIMGSIG